MIFKYGRGLAERQVNGQTVSDCVITVPSYFTQEQRLMVIDAAKMAGLDPTQLVHENVAAATMFGIDRLDNEKDLHMLIYNMGGVDTEVTLVRYSAIKDDRNKEFEHIEVLAEAWDAHLGGQDFDLVITEMLVEAFNNLPERKGKADVRTNDRAMKRIQKEAIKFKDVLSSNKIADVKIPELMEYVTLKTQIHRADFEERSQHIFSKVHKPIEKVLEISGVSLEEIDQVEIVGGGLRVPHVQELIKEATGKSELMVHLNGDEAMSFGSSFIAANYSDQFQVRKVFLTMHPLHDYKVKIRPLAEDYADLMREEVNGYEKDFMLITRKDKVAEVKKVNFNYNVDCVI